MPARFSQPATLNPGGGGSVTAVDFDLVDFEFSVSNSLVIDCFAGYFTQFLNPGEGFRVDLAPCWCVGCHVHA